MSELNTQFGISFDANFDENTWSFEMPNDFHVTAGKFAILPKQKYQDLLRVLRIVRNSIAAHPDCMPNSEFEDMVSSCDDALLSVDDTISNHMNTNESNNPQV